MSSAKHLLTGLVVLGAMVATDSAMAESLFTRDRNVSVLQRERPEYDAPGIRAGSFIIKPKVDLMAGYSDNVFAVSEDVSPEFGDRDDYYFILRPSARVASDWNRHSLSGGTYVEAWKHDRFDENNVVNYGVFADGRLDVRRQMALVAGGSYDLLHEGRKATNTAFLSVDPVEYERSSVYGGIEHELGRIRYRGRLNYRNFDFKDAEDFVTGAELDQDFRDREETSVLLQAGYAVTRDSSVFLRGTYTERSYDTLTPAGLNRDSQGYTISAGVDFDITRLARGSVAVGYLQEEFDDAALETIDGLSIDGAVEWFPTETLTARLQASRAVRASALQETGGYIASDITAGLDYELRRNIILSATAGYGESDYQDIDRTEERYGINLAGQYLINRYLSTKLEYTYEQQEVDNAAAAPSFFLRDYETNEILLTLTAQR
ncbi:outer membrane beta-barrel protein [Parvularcula flava]|uniref:Outer membrane beta-barrel protein n=1 Tax=Aquisalinus luteolus TaxID=1566827 RepID=A0A8J3ESP1_9PROT|nr:outer membrane beta-barrel protein [Aquisalinus luteolus]NHK29481.1 outer membrane beta-barrel protein [Aquisalinus luteolus]GGI01814.1 hypothetical protein GCM10011355_33340 [Aquisalinus luteolus]